MMKFAVLGIAMMGVAACATAPAVDTPVEAAPEWSIAIHGGAGVITRSGLSAQREAEYRGALGEALDAGAQVLDAGGSALDAVQAATILMEDSPLFNAGHGAVFTAAGTHELDASIMSGDGRDAGAVAGLTATKNPILAARAVMEHSPHVMFAAEGADRFSAASGIEQVDNSYFSTDRRRAALSRVLRERARTAADRHGTVGAVALDRYGNLAAATSTGGMTAKAAGRVGDSPLIGAATYAQNGICAVSATGHGEYFIRVGVAKTICSRIELAGDSLDVAAATALGEVAELGGDGGVILMGGDGDVAFVFNSEGMYRGRATPDTREIAIYGDE